jgi:thiol-disulfide isomerase/thioredoxin
LIGADQEYLVPGSNDKWTLLDFWGTWCVPCVAEMPKLQKFSREYKSELDVLAVAYKDTKGSVRNFMEKHSYTFQAGLAEDELINLFNVTAYPTKILISPGGKYTELSSESVDWDVACRNYMSP